MLKTVAVGVGGGGVVTGSVKMRTYYVLDAENDTVLHHSLKKGRKTGVETCFTHFVCLIYFQSVGITHCNTVAEND